MFIFGEQILALEIQSFSRRQKLFYEKSFYIRHRPYLNIKLSSLDTEVISELIHNGKAQTIFNQKKALLKQANRIYDSYFPVGQAQGNPLSYFRWLPLSSRAPGREVEEDIKRKQVHVLHSDRFISGGQSSEQKYLRLSLSATHSFEELTEGLRRLNHYFQTGGGSN
ncbi:hypothetical protein [Marinococcus sp. PL1-022]|uniref:hypothetical protein n=1 Tax=Marinococcus sp. PL1-022 TaxID=3095363 RepID=UPI0029C567DD|nr:hypothetical protein [Marinococcus sp. PL1-022]MDX6152633.1 hypothetical protein [Marinococcus sp. PL1-022]